MRNISLHDASHTLISDILPLKDSSQAYGEMPCAPQNLPRVCLCWEGRKMMRILGCFACSEQLAKEDFAHDITWPIMTPRIMSCIVMLCHQIQHRISRAPFPWPDRRGVEPPWSAERKMKSATNLWLKFVEQNAFLMQNGSKSPVASRKICRKWHELSTKSKHLCCWENLFLLQDVSDPLHCHKL